MRLRRRRAIVATRPVIDSDALAGAVLTGTTGWKAFGHGQHASDQIGAYAGTVLTQYPVNLPGVQRHCGVEGLRSGYYYPTRSVVPLPEQQTTRAGSRLIAGPQRKGQTYTGPIGPTNVALMQANVRQQAQAQGVGTGLPINLRQPGSD